MLKHRQWIRKRGDQPQPKLRLSVARDHENDQIATEAHGAGAENAERADPDHTIAITVDPGADLAHDIQINVDQDLLGDIEVDHHLVIRADHDTAALDHMIRGIIVVVDHTTTVVVTLVATVEHLDGRLDAGVIKGLIQDILILRVSLLAIL